jgi:kynurenine formamidase
MCLPGTIETVREQAEREGVSRRALLAGGGAAAVAAVLPGVADARKRRGWGHGGHGGGPRFGRVTDLTHLFRAGFPVYVGDEPARETIDDYASDGFYAQKWTFGEHSGTHMDAPGHFVPGARRVPQLRPEELLAPAVVIDISERAASNPDAEVEPRDLRRYERRHGRIPRGALVLMNSGWAAKVNDTAAFKNADAGGTFHFPGFGIAAVEWLLERRDIRGIGVDTLSLDPGNSTTFAVHNRLLGADRYGLENVANLPALRPRGAYVSVGVIPWEEGSGGPCRVLAYG